MAGLVPAIPLGTHRTRMIGITGTSPVMTDAKLRGDHSFASEISGDVGFFMPTT
jgi:hypothetical protein